jgi:outer membrane protein TolC
MSFSFCWWGSGGSRTRLKWPLLGLLFGAASRLCAEPEPVTAELVARLAEEMRHQHPALRATDSRVEAAQAAAAGTRRWANPEFQAGVGVYRYADMARENGDVFYGVQQNLPVLGKERAARVVAETELAAARVRVETRFTELRRDLALGLFEAAYRRQVVDTVRQDLDWLASLHVNARARLAVGKDSAVTLLRLENEQARRQLDLTNRLAELAEIQISLQRALGRTNGASPGEFSLPPVGDEFPVGPVLIRLAETSDPVSRTRAAERQVAEATVEATRKSARPDVGIGAQAYQYTGDGGIAQGMFTVNLSLPWFNRANYRRDLRRDEARREASRHEEAEAQADVRREVARLSTALASARRSARAYQGELRSRTEATLRLLEVSWTSGGAELRDLLEVRRQLVETDREALRATADYWRTLSELLLCCGLEDAETLRAALETGTEPRMTGPGEKTGGAKERNERKEQTR